jgi:hypothetical protein
MVVRLKDLNSDSQGSPQKGLVRLSDINKSSLPQAVVSRASENAQYADQMKQAYNNNPEAFAPVTTEPVDKSRQLPIIGPVLKGLDWFGKTPIQHAIADVGQMFYTPGAGLANIAGLTGAAESAVARTLPKLGPFAQKGISEAIVGAPLAAGQTLANNPDASTGEFLKQTAFGSLLGGTLGMAGKYAGTKIGAALDNWRANRNPQVEQQVSDMLALPPGRGEQRLNAAMDRSNLPSNESPIAGQGGFAEPLALPQGSYVQPSRLKVASGNQTLDYVMNQIKPEVESAIAVPTRRDQLITYIQDHLQIPREEIHNMPHTDLQELGQMVRQNISVYDKAVQAASKRGYDLPSLLEGQAPKVSQQVARNAQERIAGVYPENAPIIAKPESFNRSTVDGAGLPRERVGLRQPQVEVTSPKRNFAQFESVQSRPAQVTPVRPVNQPIQQRGFTDTLLESDKAPQGLKDRLKSAYTPISNETSVLQANKRVDKDLEAAASYVMGKSPTSAEKVTTAHRLIDEFSKRGNFERANDIADKVAEELTKAGQSVQAASIYNRLTPEGILVHAQRIAKRVNESLPITAKEVKVTPDMAAKLTDLTQITRQMTGVKDLSHDVLNILDRAKSGEKLSPADTETLKKFVNESKQFIQEAKPKANADKPPRPPHQPKDKRVRDNVVSFLDAQEQAAKERLRAKGIRISSTPLDIWADYAIIGAAKMAKGTIKLADWSEQMVKDLGEEIRPHLRNLYDMSVESFNQSTKKVTSQTISNAERVTNKFVKDALEGKQIDQTQADSLRSLAQNVSRLSGQEKSTASQDLQAILQELNRPGVLKKVSSVQTIGQLLNPKTQVRNVLGNELFYRLERLNKTLATPIDIVRSKITGGDRTVTFKTNNQGEFWKNWLSGLKAGWKGVNINGLSTQYDLSGQAFKSKYNPLTYMEKALGASLKSFDNAAYMRAYNNTLGELGTLRAINEGRSGDKTLIEKYIREADDNVMKIADEYGKYVTFQDNNAISNTLVKAKRVMNLGKDFGVGDLVLKYPKTPGALLMRALEYSPAGFIRSAAILARPIFKGEANTAEVTQALTRAIIGTAGLSGLGFFLLDKGILTGSASKDKDVRDLQKSAGQGQYQVNLSALFRLVKSGFNTDAAKLNENDLLYTYDWMQPVSVAVSMGANVAKNMSEGKQKLSGLAGTAYNSIEGGLGTLTEQSVLSGIKTAVQGYPGQTVTDKITDILSSVPSSFVPTYLNQAKQLTDNVKRETYSPSKIEQSLNLAKAKVPGLAGKLPQQYDTLGQPKQTYQDNSVGNVLFNPGFSSRYQLSPEAKMIVDLMDESGDESVAPRVPVKTITVDGQKVKLNGDQLSRLEQLQGTETTKQLDKKYRESASLDKRVTTVQKLLTDSGTKARDQLVKEFPGLKPPKAVH